jgi:LysR family transcriptional regulator, low CO2-responsive transcriptional regulator
MSNPVTWARMRTFLTVADLGSIRAAAAHLHVTEPAVSSAVTHIERHLGADLFTREGRGIRLSPAGETYAGYCRTMLGMAEEAEAAVHAAGTARVRIGAVATAAETTLPQLLSTFRAQHPDVELSLSVLPRDDLFVELAHHETDLAIAGRPPRGSGLVSVAERPNRLIVVAGAGYDVPPRAATWLLRGAGSGTRETCLALLEQHGWQPPVLTLGTHGAVVAAAKEGLGLTVVHADAVSTALDDGTLRRVSVAGTPLDRPWHVVTNATPPPAARLFLDHLCAPDRPAHVRFHPRIRPRG